MTQQRSPTTGWVYPIGMACRVLGVARSSYYASRRATPSEVAPAKRGPKTALSDEALCVEIKRVIDECPFHGEGHRKVRARLVAQGIQVGRNRVLRLMRLKGWLAPVRAGNPHGPKAHDGRITTDRPDDMWGADATRFYTRRDGWCWWFGAVDHYTDEAMGWATAKIGTRFVAMESIREGCHRAFGAAQQDCARGLTIRCDHGSQYLSRAFQAEMKYLGAEISWSFVNEPQGNGICERFIRTLKEQCIWLHDFETLEEAHQAIAEFIERYNSQWLIERLGHRSPNQARDDYDNGRYDAVA